MNAKRPTHRRWRYLGAEACRPNGVWNRWLCERPPNGMRALLVLSQWHPRISAPDDSGDYIPQWLVSVSARRTVAGVLVDEPLVPTDAEMRRVRLDFGMTDAEEDNHADGVARKLFLCVDPRRRVDCECKATERVIVREDGYRYSVEIEGDGGRT